MGKAAKKADKSTRFRLGNHGGSEALLWEFKERPRLDETENTFVYMVAASRRDR